MTKDSFEKGLAKRRKVMGDAYVDRALSQADELTMPMQDFVTRLAWDEIWNREPLSDRDRSLINLGMIDSERSPNSFFTIVTLKSCSLSALKGSPARKLVSAR